VDASDAGSRTESAISKYRMPLMQEVVPKVRYRSIVGSCFATARFATIHFYDPSRVGPSTPDLWYITVATQASFLYLVHF